jgi:hypothetical protein
MAAVSDDFCSAIGAISGGYSKTAGSFGAIVRKRGKIFCVLEEGVKFISQAF